MVVVAGLIGFAVATEQGLDDTAAEVVELGDFHHELGPEVLQGRREIGHGACLLRRTYLLSGKRDLVFFINVGCRGTHACCVRAEERRVLGAA